MNTITIQKEKTIFWSLVAILGLCIIAYIYCVTSTIRTAVAIEDIETKQNEILLSLGQKEFEIIHLKNNISLSYAQSLGFVPVKSQVYITKQSVGFLPKNSHEI